MMDQDTLPVGAEEPESPESNKKIIATVPETRLVPNDEARFFNGERIILTKLDYSV